MSEKEINDLLSMEKQGQEAHSKNDIETLWILYNQLLGFAKAGVK